jgi:uncharacterized damage-inducible protein DinB
MNTIEHLRALFSYNDWANRRTVASLKRDSCDAARKILAHLLITEKEYFERLYGKDSTGFNFWQDLLIEECGALARETAEIYDRLLKRFDEEGLDLRAKYKTSEGVEHENTFRELLSHVIVHSATHRGNIVAKMREAKLEPPKIDYIIYLRETKYV